MRIAFLLAQVSRAWTPAMIYDNFHQVYCFTSNSSPLAWLLGLRLAQEPWLMVATGIWLFPDTDAPALVAAFEAAESAGLDEVWLGDEGAPNRDPFALLAAAAVKTSRALLGVAVTNPYLRHPAVTSSAMMTVQELSGGRAVLGIGAGGGISLGPLGISPERPLQRVRDFIRIARAVSTGTPTEGYSPPEGAFRVGSLPIYVGSRSERLNRLASLMADGVFIGATPSFLLDATLGWARSVHPVPVALYVNAAFDQGELEWARPRLVQALLDAPEVTRRSFGLEDAKLRPAIAALAGGDDGAARRLVTDEIVDHLMLSGGPGRMARRIADMARKYQPASIGICLRTSTRPEMVHQSAAVLAAARKELS
jgi:5,10-methylenetetrahydromethanopterin reductase